MLIFICVTWLSWRSFVVEEEDSSYFKDHTNIYVLVYIVKVTCYLARLPFSFEVFLGFFFYNPFATEIKTQNDYNKETTNHTLLFRVVTRGLFPDLVRNTLKRNMEMIENVGIKHYMFEVVTNSKIGLNPYKRLREVVIPINYVTPKGSLYKARSLQYCLEPHINKLKDNDWIIHLDEETLLTKDIIHGIIQFTRENEFQFGQAVTKFADEDIINWVTTFGDIHRVGADYGHLRNCLKCFNITFDNWRGNFLVSKLAAEREITFDFGPNGSITEDCTFGMVAASKGYTFGFVNGEVWEKSPFTVYDFIKQRQRWIKGVILSLTIQRNTI
ncbi:hypothetical protein KUTeg_018331 [Tegillarca granosa]|uniref:Glycosyltransferase 2-like domain-containing protein n=1 Tax=Tegillarca granosa TaxID=220873 RepID=A0ABQ9EHL1_TEGGR|nr:hypothetical protein KUTeg_018331 [Tegillarca granosa]